MENKRQKENKESREEEQMKIIIYSVTFRVVLSLFILSSIHLYPHICIHPPAIVSFPSPKESEVEIAAVEEPHERIFADFRGGGMQVSERTILIWNHQTTTN